MRRLLVVVGLLAFAAAARANRFYPMVMAVRPVAIQAGATSEVEFESRYSMHGAYQVHVTGTGVTGTVDPPAPVKGTPPPVTRLKVRFKTAADALPGIRDVRLVTPQGSSTLGQLVVVRDPIVVEAANNNTLKTAQSISLAAAVCGVLEAAEDVDFFKFSVTAGQALTFHVICHRLADRIHDLQAVPDPILFVRDAGGNVIASNDNHFAADPLLHVRFDRAGTYYLEVRDVRYAGESHWTYCIEINDRPFVTAVAPLHVRPGATTRLKLDGYNLPAKETDLTIPADAPRGVQRFVLPVGKGGTSNPISLVVSDLPAVAEAAGDNNSAAKAQPIPVPCAVSGAMDADGDVDHYVFDAKKGDKYSFDVLAQRAGTRLDSFLRVVGLKGERYVENDDHQERTSGYSSFNLVADSRIEGWTAPADGKYVLQIRDVHQRGGPGFGYFLQVTRSQPTFVMDLDTDKTNLAPGTGGVIHVRLTRKDGFDGEVTLSVDGLPAGVQATCGRISAGRTDGCIVLQAAPDARRGNANVRVFGTATVAGSPTPLKAQARPLQEFYSPGGGRNHFPVAMHTVAVGDPLDLLAVQISPTEITLKPGESKKVEVTVKRQPDYKGNLTLDVIYQHLDFPYNNPLPAGVTVDGAASQTLLTGEQVKGWITLKAAPDAKPLERQLVGVMVHESVNFAIKFTFAGAPLWVTVTKP